MEFGTRIDSQGQPVGTMINIAMGNKAIGHVTVDPPTCRFVPQTTTHQPVHDGSTPYRNFEIIYGGIDGQTLRLTYREYSFDALARPAYAHPFSYPVGSRQIRFKDVVIDVADAQPDRIRYTVVADGGTP